MTFAIPATVLAEFNTYVEDAYLRSFQGMAKRTNEALKAWFAAREQGLKPRFDAFPRIVAGIYPVTTVEVGYRTLPTLVEVQVPKVRQMAQDAVEAAVVLINNRVAMNVAADETTQGAFWINKQEALIEANLNILNAQGEEIAKLSIRALWNYRYGENAANKVITQYLQFRANRTGQALAGKAAAVVVADAEKAARAEAKAAAAAEKRIAAAARFVKGLAREAKAARKYARDLITDARRTSTTAEHKAHWLNLADGYETKAQKLEAATPDDLIEVRGQQITLLDRFGTASNYAHSIY